MRIRRDVMEFLALLALFVAWIIGGYVFTKFDGEMIAFLGLYDAYGWEQGMHYFYMLTFLATWSLLGFATITAIKLYTMLRKKGVAATQQQEEAVEAIAQEGEGVHQEEVVQEGEVEVVQEEEAEVVQEEEWDVAQEGWADVIQEEVDEDDARV
jgi:hypothetical protein